MGAALGSDDLLRGVAFRELAGVVNGRRAHLVGVDQPLVLVSQIPRSGGTLLMRLLDGHPQCHTVPHEYGIRWPKESVLGASAERAWEAMTDRKLRRYFESRYSQSHSKLSGTEENLPLPAAAVVAQGALPGPL